MPPRGWKKPPGSLAYARQRATTKRKPKPSTRTAGPHMLPGRGRAFGNLDIGTLSESEPELPEDDAVVEADAESAEENDDDQNGPPSQRLRLRQGAPSQAEEGEDVSGAEADSDGGMPAMFDDGSDGEEHEAQSQPNTAAARARRARDARVLEEDDPLDDVPARPTPATTNGPPVNQELHLLDLSVTLSKSKSHINPAWLTLVHEWMKLRCEAGAVAQERGGKAQHLHLQIMLRMRIASMDIEALKLELKTLVGWQRGDGSGCYCSAKEFGAGQEPKTNSM